MGTRADFYIGIRKPEWIGSITQDGHPWNIACKILIQVNKTMYEENVNEFLEMKNGIIHFRQGKNDKWPWSWEDSQLTDYSYFFSEQYGKVYAYSMREKIMFNPLKVMQGEDLKTSAIAIVPNFPKMGVTYGSKITAAL